MTYTSLRFLIFTAFCLLIYGVMPRKCRWCVLLTASLGFYVIVLALGMELGMATCIKYLAFMVFTAASTYAGGLLLERQAARSDAALKAGKALWSKEEKKAFKEKAARSRKHIAAGVLAANFGILAFLKYYNFLADSLNGILKHFSSGLPGLRLFLPLGISFYTFQSMGYVIDIYRKKYPAERNFFKLLLFVSFFPQIVQGPIGLYSDLGHQLYEGKSLRFENIKQGVLLITWGFFKKLVIADKLVKAVTDIPGDYKHYSGTAILAAALIYALQLYADFSGGIDISRGVAQLFGITMAENFRRPYFSKDISEYWHRWHITLGAWLREYLFYPIAMSKLFQKFSKKLKERFGMKAAKVIPVSIASLITFLVVGVWHGANWKYVAFGVWNGGIIMVSTLLESSFTRWKQKLKIKDDSRIFNAFRVLRTFIIVLIGYYFDIADSFKSAMEMMYLSVTDLHISELASRYVFDCISVTIRESLVVIAAALVMLRVSVLQERDPSHTLREKICKKGFAMESLVFLALFFSVLIFGVYGPGNDPADFYYMQF
ncbi:MAG: MBOAT family protein [Ruminococcus sp.]|nr:MBOAT family protein [Ruminococcus sp.]